jgi:D-aspartate ligase
VSAAAAASSASNRPPVILVGANVVTAVSVIRSLGRAGVDVRLLCRAGAAPSYSRHARRLPVDPALPSQEAWLGFLLGSQSRTLRGAVLLACNDDGVELLVEHRDALAAEYVLDVCDVDAQRTMLDKLATYRKAAEIDVPTPRFWPAESEARVRSQKDQYVYPLLVKPLHSHRFKRVHEGKYLVARDFEELTDAFRTAQARDVEVMLLEVIPGPDDLLCSYYTYIDDSGTARFHFTKRVIRRFPEHEGFGCYHITDWNPEVRDLGLRLFRHVGLKGIANVEFKRDPRDGMLKLIECNARFTAANGLLVASGYDLGLFVYDRLTGRPTPDLADIEYRRGLRLWSPLDDFLAFRELRRRGRLSFAEWLRSVLHRQVLPYFSWSDPLPSLVRLTMMLRTLAAENVRRVTAREPTDARRETRF